jgi:ABC-2 type transport system ATP-binding protein
MSVLAANAIEIEGLGVADDRAPGAALAVRRDEIFGVLGRDGAGKSGLLRAIAGLASLPAGTIRVFGDPPDRPASRARLAYLPASFNPPGYLRGHDFVRLVLACHGARARRARTALLAEQLGLDPEVLDRPLRSCAKGVAQRLGVLAVLLTERPLLVLDEPMRGLDPGARRMVKEQLAAGRRRGRTLLLSSPIAADLEDLCDRVAVFEAGRLCDLGVPADLRARHRAPTLASAARAALRHGVS